MYTVLARHADPRTTEHYDRARGKCVSLAIRDHPELAGCQSDD
jgi:hypothetical protein